MIRDKYIPKCPVCGNKKNVKYSYSQDMHYCFLCDCYIHSEKKIIPYDSTDWKPITATRRRKAFLKSKYIKKLGVEG